MKKFLYGFSIFLIVSGTIGLINHISIMFKAVSAEQAMFNGYNPSMIHLQLIDTIGPYLTCIIGGGFLLVLTIFLTEYQKRNELTNQILQVFIEKQTTASEADIQQETAVNSTYTTEQQPTKPTNQQHDVEHKDSVDDRLYWKG